MNIINSPESEYGFTESKAGNLPCIMVDINLKQEQLGQILLVPHSDQMYEVHLSAIVPEHRGNTEKILYEGMNMIFNSVETLQKLIALIPKHNKLSVLLCEKNGFTHEGTLTKSFLYEDKMEDLEIYGISRGER